ncbi:MAG: PglZ domain-containing protein [Deltaproteobacteria bacterium HGW-Deltaproteobacteria-14]|jgi:hypothetical protein|nr:MAG: PglZ domain-containing protein [Deltaproteobacteria bacterium HGW-Deltaproteobacteria-14]
MPPSTPVSDALEAELSELVSRNGLVLWRDSSGHYARFAERLAARAEAGALGFPVVRFEGSFLAAMLALEPHLDGADKGKLLVYVPGLASDLMSRSPLLEVQRVAREFRRKLTTLVEQAAVGFVRADALAAFTARGDLTLELADAWLAAAAAGDTQRDAEVLRPLTLEHVVERLIDTPDFAASFGAGVLRSHLAAATGMSDAWWDAAAADGRVPAAIVASWALAVEYVHDLSRPPIMAELAAHAVLQKPLVVACQRLCSWLRERKADFYERTADDTALALEAERTGGSPDDLGKIDTFRFEEERILDAALDALRGQRWPRAVAWATEREGARSFWLGRDHRRRNAWHLVTDAAALGSALEAGATFLRGVETVGDAALAYAELGADVDEAHRRLEQRREVLLLPTQVTDYDALREVLDDLRERYAEWADAIARETNARCRRAGFLPPVGLQQRTIFEQVVRPFAREHKTAFIVVDALRYELGRALARRFAETHGVHVTLSPRLAELPTVSAVGMNLLAPVDEGRPLQVVLRDGEPAEIRGFAAREFQVTEREDRRRLMHDRVGGGTCPLWSLSEVLHRDAASLRQGLAQARLVVVTSDEIDKAGHAGVGPQAFEQVLLKLEGAWRVLREAGVTHFVVTADHGFVLLDPATRRTRGRGARRGDKPLRHALSEVAAAASGEVSVPLAGLDYDDARYLVMPEDCAVFDPGKKPTPFVHGGNSLQERVIPVLTLEHRAAPGASATVYRIEDVVGVADASGRHRVGARVVPAAQMGLGFGGAPSLTLALRVVDEPGVSVAVQGASGAAGADGERIDAQVGKPFEVYFTLRGVTDRQVSVELYHPLGRARVEPGVTATRFPVSASRGRVAAEEVPEGDRTSWLAAFEDPRVRKVFELIERHGSVGEAELLTLLGGGRQVRQFARRIEEYAGRAPFAVRVETATGSKRYVREGGG